VEVRGDDYFVERHQIRKLWFWFWLFIVAMAGRLSFAPWFWFNGPTRNPAMMTRPTITLAVELSHTIRMVGEVMIFEELRVHLLITLGRCSA